MIQGQNLVARKNFKFSFFIIFEKYYEISIFIFVGYKEKKKKEKSQSQCTKIIETEVTHPNLIKE